MAGSWKFEKDIKLAEVLTDGLKASYEVGFGCLFAEAMKNVAISNPFIKFGLRVATGLVGAAYGKLLYDFVDEQFDVEEKVWKICGPDKKEAEDEE